MANGNTQQTQQRIRSRGHKNIQLHPMCEEQHELDVQCTPQHTKTHLQAHLNIYEHTSKHNTWEGHR